METAQHLFSVDSVKMLWHCWLQSRNRIQSTKCVCTPGQQDVQHTLPRCEKCCGYFESNLHVHINFHAVEQQQLLLFSQSSSDYKYHSSAPKYMRA